MLDPSPLGHELVGTGARPVIVLNDWLCDTSTWDGARIYLDRDTFCWAFADVRGYGRSRGRSGSFDLQEAAADVLALADAQGWPHFAIVGHSMSTLVALQLAQHHAERITQTVLITPPPPTGFGVTDAQLEASRALALGDDALRWQQLAGRFDKRLTTTWAKLKLERWRATSDPSAVAGYVSMFARTGLPEPRVPVRGPVLAITGEHDMPAMRSVAVTAALSSFCEQLTVVPIADASHYPMQETPPLLVAHIERFLSAGNTAKAG
ncbi:MAG: hypothetical protein JWN48_5740 [Myxococcaceae bacterium]|nr:hypothetical protein [Myxococcaceae bacterium]